MHRARLVTGEGVAVKIQRPDVRGVSCTIGLVTVTVGLVGLAVLLIALFGFPSLPDLARANGNAYDFGIFYRSTGALWTGGEIYPAGQPNFAPPITMVALGPLALLPATAAYRVFVVASVAALITATRLPSRSSAAV